MKKRLGKKVVCMVVAVAMVLLAAPLPVVSAMDVGDNCVIIITPPEDLPPRRDGEE